MISTARRSGRREDPVVRYERCRRAEALLEPSAPLGAGDQANPRGSMLPDHVSCPALLFPDLVELHVKLRDGYYIA